MRRMLATSGLLALGLGVCLSVATASAGDPAAPTGTTPTTTTVAPPATTPATPDTTAPTATTKTFTLDADPKKSNLFVIVKNDPSSLLSGFAHDHAIGATGWTGTVQWPQDAGGTCKIEITVPVSGLEVDLPGYREKAGLSAQEVSDDDKVKIKENFSGPRQLDAKNYPNISFKSTACKGSGTSWMIEGDFTLKAVTKKVIIPMNIKTDGTAFAASGKVTLRGSDFGMSPFAAVGGTLRNQDSLTFVIDVKSK